MILTTCTTRYDSNTPSVSIEETIEPEKVGLIIGTKGSMIMEIMKKSGAKVVINQDFPKGQPHKIIYSGRSPHKFFFLSSSCSQHKFLTIGMHSHTSVSLNMQARKIK
jgi:KH domain